MSRLHCVITPIYLYYTRIYKHVCIHIYAMTQCSGCAGVGVCVGEKGVCVWVGVGGWAWVSVGVGECGWVWGKGVCVCVCVWCGWG